MAFACQGIVRLSWNAIAEHLQNGQCRGMYHSRSMTLETKRRAGRLCSRGDRVVRDGGRRWARNAGMHACRMSIASSSVVEPWAKAKARRVPGGAGNASGPSELNGWLTRARHENASRALAREASVLPGAASSTLCVPSHSLSCTPYRLVPTPRPSSPVSFHRFIHSFNSLTAHCPENSSVCCCTGCQSRLTVIDLLFTVQPVLPRDSTTGRH